MQKEQATNEPKSAALAQIDRRLQWSDALLICWTTGALAVAVRTIVCTRRLGRAVRSLLPVTDPAVLALRDDCAALLGLRRRPPMLVGDGVPTPAVAGLSRPDLLLPRAVLEQFDRDQLRLIVLHELAHLKRRDLWFGSLWTAALVLHWFNPLVWLASARANADRELACDELVLNVTTATTTAVTTTIDRRPHQAYGQTLLKLIETLSPRTTQPSTQLAGILEGRRQMRRRVTMIARFDARQSRRGLTWTILLAALLGAVAMTDAITAQPAASTQRATAPRAPTTAPTSVVVIDGAATSAQMLDRLQKGLPEVNFDQVPLSAALDSIRKDGGLNMTINWSALEAAGVDRNAPVAMQLKNVTFEQALDHLLSMAGGGQVRLEHDVIDGAVVVSTSEDLTRYATLEFFDVQDLIAPATAGAPTTQAYQERTDMLIKMIENLIASESWKDNGGTVGSLYVYDYKLVVQQTPRNQREIVRFLTKLRETAARTPKR